MVLLGADIFLYFDLSVVMLLHRSSFIIANVMSAFAVKQSWQPY